MNDVAVIRTGTANLASVLAGLKRAKCKAVLVDEPGAVASADYVVLPGVGAFAAIMDQLNSRGLVDAIRQRVNEARPTLAICLGLQVLGSSSEESPGTEGIGVFDVRASRFGEAVRVPQLGWNLVRPAPDCRLLTGGYGYFANSYRLTEIPQGWAGAMADYGGAFVAAIERGPILACQFHPELSGKWGASLIERWLGAAREPAPC
ncbi:MAG: imidazole glycerol phosphate synthase subunit HisH [Arenicellales bacterium]|jgi:imidazole glycerol phosphate synthase glutamine amidotransferase subunit|nr:imidazole glycerol phosphate synthase subunit HisH [Arenicellales bacterium]MDP6792019.1 imidazole glycerol phosphate synthase subunit HisH [Arenicellales bacterium]MDP6917625.1 imidazole glycerol phosphate synthase subunit HisH [Arenicellales bacterium]|tara:strand:+ start:206 stop:820 length:615 start_codon:yes stop_codon:yes gene_type:complete